MKLKEYTIYPWMRDKLNLKGNHLLVYALIFKESQGGLVTYKGGLSGIQKQTGCSKGTAIKTLKDLVDLGLIKRLSDTGSSKISYKHLPILK